MARDPRRQTVNDFRTGASTLAAAPRARHNAVFAQHDALKKLYQMRQDLTALWGRSTESKEQLVTRWKAWRTSAETSNIATLQAFSQRLARFA